MDTISNNNFRLFFKHISYIFIIVCFSNCFEEPEYPNTPLIAFQNLAFHEEETGMDSLILEFTFQDGNGDLGLAATSTFYPYQDFYVVWDDLNNQPISLSSTSLPEFQSLKILRKEAIVNTTSTNFEYSVLNGIFSPRTELPTYNCEDYTILMVKNDGTDFLLPSDVSVAEQSNYSLDTVLIEKSPFSKNFYIDFYIEQETDNFVLAREGSELYSFSDEGCYIPFHGRFPILDVESGLDDSSLEGTIRYSMSHLAFRYVFGNNRFKMKFYIYDWNLHQSNVVETRPFTMDELTL